MKNLLKKKWILILIILIFCFLFFVFYDKKYSSHELDLAPVITDAVIVNPAQAKDSYPVRLKIPVIGVDSLIEYVGLTSDGKMEAPKDAKNVAWFKLGTLPGEEGSAVITGHFDDKNGREAVFYNLKKINKGDQLFIEDGLGESITFVVREIRIYDSEAFTPEIFTSSNGQHLNLITCAGAWSQSQKKYIKRLVVFADREI